MKKFLNNENSEKCQNIYEIYCEERHNSKKHIIKYYFWNFVIKGNSTLVQCVYKKNALIFYSSNEFII